MLGEDDVVVACLVSLQDSDVVVFPSRHSCFQIAILSLLERFSPALDPRSLSSPGARDSVSKKNTRRSVSFEQCFP
jgi:hypothetical protein